MKTNLEKSKFFQYVIDYIEPLSNYYDSSKKSLTYKQAKELADKYQSLFEQKRLMSILLNYDSIHLKDNIIDVYKFSNTSILKQNANCKAYILFNVNDNCVLMEVTWLYIKNTGIDFYILASDMRKIEKIENVDNHKRIKCDYIYNYKDKTLAHETERQKIFKK